MTNQNVRLAPEHIQSLTDGLLAAKALRDAKAAASADVTEAPVKAAPAKKATPKAKAAPKAAPAAKAERLSPATEAKAAIVAKTGKVFASLPDTNLVCVVDTGTGSSLAGVGYEVTPVRYKGEWVWSVPGMAKPEVSGNALLRHPAYVKAGRFMAIVENSQAKVEEAVRTRIRSKAAGANTAARRTSENLQAYRAWVAEVAAERPA